MATSLHNTGEEFYQKSALANATSFTVGLFDDSTAALDDDSVLADVQAAEPDTAQTYAVQTATFKVQDGGETAGDKPDWELVNDGEITFDVSGNNEDVDSYYITVNYDQDGNAGDEEVLFATGDLSQSYALGNLDTLKLSDAGIGTSLT